MGWDGMGWDDQLALCATSTRNGWTASYLESTWRNNDEWILNRPKVFGFVSVQDPVVVSSGRLVEGSC